MKKTIRTTFAALLAASALVGCGTGSSASGNSEPIAIAIPDDATNGARGIKLLEKAGLIEVDPAAGYSPELKDVTNYLYNIEIKPQAADTLPQTLDDIGAATINATYALPAGLNPADGLLVEDQGEDGDNPYVNIIVARSADVNNKTYQTIVEAYQTEYVAAYIEGKYKGATIPVFSYEDTGLDKAAVVEEVDAYKNTTSSDGKTVVKVGVCGANNDQWYAVQKVLDDANEGIYIELVTFDAYNLPNDALNAGDIDLNAFQHKAYLNNEIANAGYAIEPIGDTLIAPLTIYSNKYTSLDALKEAAGKKAE